MVEATEDAKAEAKAERREASTVNVDTSPTDAANAILEAIADLKGDVQGVHSRLDDHDEEISSLRRAIHGSKRPPKDGPPIAEMAKRGSSAAFDVEELRGELLAVRTELAKQSSAMGLGKRWIDFLFSAAGLRAVVRLATLVGAAYAALHTSGAI